MVHGLLGRQQESCGSEVTSAGLLLTSGCSEGFTICCNRIRIRTGCDVYVELSTLCQNSEIGFFYLNTFLLKNGGTSRQKLAFSFLMRPHIVKQHIPRILLIP